MMYQVYDLLSLYFEFSTTLYLQTEDVNFGFHSLSGLGCITGLSAGMLNRKTIAY